MTPDYQDPAFHEPPTAGESLAGNILVALVAFIGAIGLAVGITKALGL